MVKQDENGSVDLSGYGKGVNKIGTPMGNVSVSEFNKTHGVQQQGVAKEEPQSVVMKKNNIWSEPKWDKAPKTTAPSVANTPANNEAPKAEGVATNKPAGYDLSPEEQKAMDAINAAANDYKPGNDEAQSVMDYLNAKNKSDEDKHRKRNESMKKVLLLADALRHIGNIVNTSKGAPAQIFNSPVEEQEKRYQTEKAGRDKELQTAIENEREKAKNKADADYKASLLKMKAADYGRRVFNDNRTYNLNKDKAEHQAEKDDKTLDLRGRAQNETERKNKANESIARDRVAVAQQNANTSSVRAAKQKDNSRSGGGSGKPYGTLLGVEYQNKADYEKAVQREAAKHGVSTTTGSRWKPKKRTYPEIAKDIEAKAGMNKYKRNNTRSTPKKRQNTPKNTKAPLS